MARTHHRARHRLTRKRCALIGTIRRWRRCEQIKKEKKTQSTRSSRKGYYKAVYATLPRLRIITVSGYSGGGGEGGRRRTQPPQTACKMSQNYCQYYRILIHAIVFIKPPPRDLNLCKNSNPAHSLNISSGGHPWFMMVTPGDGLIFPRHDANVLRRGHVSAAAVAAAVRSRWRRPARAELVIVLTGDTINYLHHYTFQKRRKTNRGIPPTIIGNNV